MKVLHVVGSKHDSINAAVSAQISSLAPYIDNEISLYETGSIKQYLRARNSFARITKLSQQYDIIHAHFSRSFFVAWPPKVPVVVSFMGTDVFGKSFINNLLLKHIDSLNVHKIVKSYRMVEKFANKKYINVIPNGVDFNKFFFEEKDSAREILKLDKNKMFALFLADPKRPEKDFALATKTVQLCNDLYQSKINLLSVHGLEHEMVRTYLNASDVLLLTSRYEGSPNVVKEAMACSRPIVSTDVGDVKSITEGALGCFACDHNAVDLAAKLFEAVKVAKTNGRERIKDLSSEIIAQKILDVYSMAIGNK